MKKTTGRRKKTTQSRKAGEPALAGRTRVVDVAGALSELAAEDAEFVATSVLRVEGGSKYEMGRSISKGSMGSVSRARDMNCRRTVAMKALSKDQQRRSKEDLIRFIEEAQITSQLEHPNIVPVHELGLDAEGNVYYTMKFVKGLTLTEILDEVRHGNEVMIEQYPLSALLTIYQKVCDAVAFAHSRGVVHRDLKPDNIMIGGYGEVLVMDWGLAKVLRSPQVTTSADVPITASMPAAPAGGQELPWKKEEAPKHETIDSVRSDDIGTGLKTISGRVMGTPGFMAPEQARAGGDVGPSADIYSLGAILYSILTLRAPVTGKDIKEVLRRILHGEIAPPVAYNRTGEGGGPRDPPAASAAVNLAHCPGGQIPVVLSEVAMKALSTDPADRFPAVKDLQREVEAYQGGHVWHLVVDEDFSDPEAFLSRWEVVGGQHEVGGGVLRLHGGEPQMILLKRDVPGDVRIDFECSQEGAYLNTLGCFVSAIRSENRREVPSSGYEFKYGAYDNSMNVLSRADAKLWTQQASSIVRGRRYHVRAERVGSRLRLMVNNEEVFRFTDPDPLSGPDRVAVGLMGWMADTRYARVRVHTLGTPMMSDVLDIAERHLLKGHYNTAKDLFQEVLDSNPDEERRAKARRGFAAAETRFDMMRNLPAWRERLEKVWPGVQLRMDNDGLTVEISNSGVTDLAPLQGLPLRSLYCAGNRIESLEPLRGMPLITLNCGGNPISSLEPLRGMPLVTLLCECCRIASLEPLKSMPLTMLNCGGNVLSDGLEPLRGLGLSWLCCWGCGADSLEPLRGMKLTALYCDTNGVRDLGPLRGMPLSTLNCSGNAIVSLEPLRGTSLTTLHCGGNRIQDLEPLHGMALTMFSCHGNEVRSLKPLKDMPLAAVMCGANRLTGIEFFVRNPPEIFLFDCDTIPTEELTWVQRTWSRDFRFASHARHAETLLALRKGDAGLLRSLAVEFRGHRYLFIPRFMTWADAKAFCEKLGGHLVTITSREENDFINSFMPGGNWFWIGLMTTEQGQRWVTGEPFQFGTFVDILRERQPGPKVFWNATWSYDVYPDARNCFMIEWEP